jgi:hypothetical protein
MKTKLASEPAVYGFMTAEQQEFRKRFPDYVKDLPQHSFLDAESFKIEGYFVGQNIGSIVMRVSDKSGTYVVKSILETKKLETECVFLKKWQEAGASTLRVLDFIKPAEAFPIACTIFEYVPEDTTEDRLENEDREVWLSTYEDLGRNLALMHKTKGGGYGEVVDTDKLKGKHSSFLEEQSSYFIPNLFENLLNAKLILEEDFLLVKKAIEIIDKDIKSGTWPTLLHNDAGIHNTFGILKIKIFDPDPYISHPALDLALASIWTCLYGNSRQLQGSLLGGYRLVGSYNDTILQASIYLCILRKWEWWLHRGKSDSNALVWIEQTKTIYDEAREKIKLYTV